jgi:hypothetical protein
MTFSKSFLYYLLMACLPYLLIGCVSAPIEKEDIFVQARQIKAEQVLKPEEPVREIIPPQPAVQTTTPVLETQNTTPPEIIPESVVYLPLQTPERLVYKAKFLNFPIGKFIIENKGKTTWNGREAWQFEITVKTAPFYAKIFKTRARYVSYMDAETMRVLRHEEYIKDGTVLEAFVDFDYANHQAIHKDIILNTEDTIAIPDQVHDILTGGFYLRMLPLEIGDTAEIKVYADSKLYDCVALMRSKTTVFVPGRGRQDVHFLKPYLFLDGKEIKKISADVFMSTDTPKKSIHSTLKTRFGSVHVVLSEDEKDK